LATDTYFGGKELALLGRQALIADELGETALAETYRASLATAFEPWLDTGAASRLVYDQTWGGVVSRDGISDAGAAFGAGYYNDHHFHYGYFIYAAAALIKEDPEWLDEGGDALLHLVRNIANPTTEDPAYTYLRNKDWFVGHSWASGLFEFGDSRNQESTSEAVNAWYAVYLYGLATDNHQLRDLGRLLLATELRSTWRYWQITSDSDIYPSPFADNKVVGVLWGTKVEYTTFFGANVEYIHGIQMLPFTPISELLLRPEWIEEEYPVLATALASPELGDGWRGFIVMAHGILDPDEAWGEALTLSEYDNGNSHTNTLYWLSTRPR
jgi:endo-1,3(4)-beta-glucanase